VSALHRVSHEGRAVTAAPHCLVVATCLLILVSSLRAFLPTYNLTQSNSTTETPINAESKVAIANPDNAVSRPPDRKTLLIVARDLLALRED